MPRLLLTLRFIGTHYHGWQVQKNALTVQNMLQDAIERVTGYRSDVIGCSRTDAGVHASMYCCSTDTDSKLYGDKMVSALNAYLPRDIAVYNCCEVGADFHPRYCAKSKQYLYRIWNSPARNPFWDGLALHVRRPVDVERLNVAAADFLGEHDFSSFCAAGSSVCNTVRHVLKCELSRNGELVVLTIQANGFLYNMVRIIMGTLLEIDAEKLPYNCISDVLKAHTRSAAGATAPACGLILDKIFY